MKGHHYNLKHGFFTSLVLDESLHTVSDKFHAQSEKTDCKKSYSEILDHKLDAQFHGGEVLHHHWIHETVCSCVYTVIIERKCGFLMVICAIKEIIKYLKIINNK